MVMLGMNSGDLRVPNVPLAQSESEDDDLFSHRKQIESSNSSSSLNTPNLKGELISCIRKRSVSELPDKSRSPCPEPGSWTMEQTFGDGQMAGSLEDLVEHFDESISKCFVDLDQGTERMAPVQVRTQEEIMQDSQIWWTLTGNFGNILPIDWSKTQTRKLQLPALNLRSKTEGDTASDVGLGLSSDDEELRQQLDLHQLQSEEHQAMNNEQPPQTAEQVIEEIDQIMQESCTLSTSMTTNRTFESIDSMYSSMRSPLPGCSRFDSEFEAKLKETADPQKLQTLSHSQLVNLQSEMEQLIQLYNEGLVQELALKDELDYEKELKNTFISLLLNVQNKRRQFANERRKKGVKIDANTLPQYCTATIPYLENADPPNNAGFQALIKILRAVNDNNSAVPTMLTDYILTVVCPSSNNSTLVL